MAKPLKSRSKRRSNAPILSVQLAGGLKKLVILSAPYAVSLVLTGLLFGSVVAYAVNSPVFQLEEVKILNYGTLTKAQAFAFCELQKGENLITLDLVNVQQLIKRKHPEFKEVRVQRVLPNTIEVLLKRRTPVAQIALVSRYMQVDKDLTVLPGSSPVPFKYLTIIQGLPVPSEGLAVGMNLNNGVAKKVFMLSDAIHRSGVIAGHTLSKIDASDARNISFYVDNDIEIRVGDSRFNEKMKLLAETLKSAPLDAAKIRYIDLRFDDIVVGPR